VVAIIVVELGVNFRLCSLFLAFHVFLFFSFFFSCFIFSFLFSSLLFIVEVFGDSSRDADNSGNDQDNDCNSSIIAFWELVGREISLLSLNGGLGSLVFDVFLVVLSNKLLAF
jgi:hypothetical protein